MHIPLPIYRRRLERWLTPRARQLSLSLKQIAMRLTNYLYRFLLFLRTILLFLLWVSFEAEIRAWDWLQRVIRQNPKHDSGDWHRLVFCVAVSLTVVQLAFVLAGMSLNVWACALCMGHGIAIHLFWEKGRRWCKRRAGLRPSRFIDPKNLYNGLDL